MMKKKMLIFFITPGINICEANTTCSDSKKQKRSCYMRNYRRKAQKEKTKTSDMLLTSISKVEKQSKKSTPEHKRQLARERN